MKDIYFKRVRLGLALVGLVLACGPGNRLLGEWVVVPELSPPGSADGLEMAGSSELRFLEDRMIAGASSMAVTYGVEKNRVTVTTPQGQGTVYEFEEDDDESMFVRTPHGPIVFRRVR
jgi:hypothetical protein